MKATEGAGEEGWTRGRVDDERKARGIKKGDERNGKEVKRTKDVERSRKTRTAGSVGTDQTAHSGAHFRRCGGREEGELNLERKRGNPLLIGAPGSLTADPDTRTATPVS